MTLANGNLDGSETGGGHKGTRSTIKFPASGKWYYEGTVTTLGGACCIGAATNAAANPDINAAGSYYILVNSSGNVQRYQSFASYTGFDTPAVGTILRVAYDADAQKLWLGLNGLWMNSSTGTTGDPATGANATFSSITDIYPAIDQQTSAVAVNFGQRAFAYTAPSGFKALVDTNLPAPVVAKGSSAMDVVLYTGNGASRNITGLNFAPDFLWIKNRNFSGYNHHLTDAVRGVSQRLRSNTTGAELTTTDQVTAYNSNGFSLGPDSAGPGDLEVNQNTGSYVAWAWDGGTSTVTNTAGSITSQVRANASAGFSVCTFTAQSSGNATVGHGLGVAPSLVIVKSRTQNLGWYIYTKTIGSSGWLQFTTAAAVTGNSAAFGGTDPTSTVFTYGSGLTSTGDIVAYCFAPVSGYSNFGSYVGNGSSDGSFVYTGFRPRWILIKASSFTQGWALFDTARSTYNASSMVFLQPNTSNSEFTTDIDILSNGFKARANDGNMNGSGQTYIYAAFAESPFQYARAR
jgi:hypothetical protein